MGIQASKIDAHWNFFLAIERDLEVLSRYVEFDERNFECFSIEIARLLVAASGEIDVVAKQVCRAIDPGSAADRIKAYRTELTANFPHISAFPVLIPRFGLTLHPWETWKRANGVPFWWTAHNKIKHHRNTEYDQANLKNALNAVAALFVMVLHLYAEKARAGQLTPSPVLLRPDEDYVSGYTAIGPELGCNYRLEGRPPDGPPA
ncbi:MAG: hypothetical protein GEU82_04960 [Luteitalea sp.]|nr:hypothetical protein [Luteitalea sp.]